MMNSICRCWESNNGVDRNYMNRSNIVFIYEIKNDNNISMVIWIIVGCLNGIVNFKSKDMVNSKNS